MTTPDGNAAEPQAPDPTAASPATAGPNAVAREGAWGAVARLLAIQLLTVVAVTAVITGIYALTGPRDDNQVAAGSSTTGTTTSSPTSSTPATSTPTAEPSAQPSASPSTSPSSPATSSQPPVSAHNLKVDVLNQSGPGGTAAKTADRVRALGWTVGRVDDFRGNVTTTTVYYPTGKAKAARELADGLPGKPRVLPRFSTLSKDRLTVIITR